MAVMKINPPKIVLCELGETGIERIQSYSPFCLKVHRALGAVGLVYESRRGAPRDFADLNPTGQVPILLVDGDVVRDSTRIVQRIVELAALAGGPSLVPADPRARAEAWLWEDYADRCLNGYLVAARWADPRNWLFVRDAYFGDAPWFVRKLIAPQIRKKVLDALVARDVTRGGDKALQDDFRSALDHLESRAPLAGFWLGTETPTVADISLFGQLQSFRTPLTSAQAREVTLRPALTDWLDRVDAATFPGRASMEATSPLGHEMPSAGSSRAPNYAQA